MLNHDLRKIGNRLLATRKKAGMTQSEVAEAAGLSDRTYADIERGSVNMRIETILRICDALHITPDDILLEKNLPSVIKQEELFSKLNACSEKDRYTALKLLEVYLQSIQ